MSKTIIISGAGQGLGLVLANHFSRHSWQVVATGRGERPDGIETDVQYLKLDSADPKATESFWQELKSKLGNQLVCLINNAGGYVGGQLLELEAEDYLNQMKSIYFTSVMMTRGLIANFDRAKIFNMLSASAMIPLKDNGAYGAAKTAAAHFFSSLQQQYPPEQYQISNLYPDKMATHGPDSNAMDPEHMAEFILLLAESDNSFYLKDAFIYSLKH